jgi:hypothetical protein
VRSIFCRAHRASTIDVFPTEASTFNSRTDNEALSAATSAKVPDSQVASEQVVLLTASQRKALQYYCRIEILSHEWIAKWPDYRRVFLKKKIPVEDRTYMRKHLTHQMYLLQSKGLSGRGSRKVRHNAWDPDSEELDYIFQKTLESIYRPIDMKSEVLEGWV